MRRRSGIIIAAFAFLALFGNRGFRLLVSRSLELGRARRDLMAHKRETVTLRQRLYALAHSDQAVEAEARKHGLLKFREIEYRFPPPSKR